jgi:hypothetical protein
MYGMYSRCPDCHGDTYKFSTEVYICKNPRCRQIDARLLYEMLRDIGVEESVIKKVQANIVTNNL